MLVGSHRLVRPILVLLAAWSVAIASDLGLSTRGRNIILACTAPLDNVAVAAARKGPNRFTDSVLEFTAPNAAHAHATLGLIATGNKHALMTRWRRSSARCG